MYDEENMLMLSGIQHFMFCPRQWALIHLEQQWADNRLTVQGHILHANVDNPFYRQKNGNVLTLRSVHIASRQLGLYGISDAVELHPAPSPTNAITHDRYPGHWFPYPVEYKRGRSKPNACDEVQLAAQTMCLEEMYGIHIPFAALYYDEVKRREVISISDALRQTTQQCADQMHALFAARQLPPASKEHFCKSCSLNDICLPEVRECAQVGNYLKRNLYEDPS